MHSRNIKLTLEYDGGRYDGFVRLGKNESSNTIQSKLVEVLKKMTGENVEIFAGARTEKGVHAHEQIVNFKTNSSMKCLEIRNYLNRYLPRDIAVLNVCEMPERFNSALNARSKTYLYRIDIRNVASVFDRKYTFYSFDKLDVSAMKDAAAYLIGKHDFAKLSSGRSNKSTVRNIETIDVYDDGEELQITIKADDFLHNMARFIVSALIDVGKKNLLPGDMEAVIKGNKPEYELIPAESEGLYLEKIEY